MPTSPRETLSFVRNYLSCTIRKTRTLLPSRSLRSLDTSLSVGGFSRRKIGDISGRDDVGIVPYRPNSSP